jgi:UTP--glucose-1-phosphate uridylyltransferase
MRYEELLASLEQLKKERAADSTQSRAIAEDEIGRLRAALGASQEQVETMAQVRAERGGTVLCAIEVTPEEVSAYGVFDVEALPDSASLNVLKVKGMVEKPSRAEAPSLFAAAGRYLLDRAIFDALRRVKRGAGGEIQLTDAIALLIAEGHPVHVVVHRGSRHDLGNPGGYLKAAVDFALDRDDYGPDLRRWLVTRLGLAEQ